MDIKQLCVDAHQISLSKGWYDPPPTIEGRLLLMHSEVTEATEDYRDNHPLQEIFYKSGHKPCGVPIEMADLVIRIADFCGWANIDLEAAIAKKMEYNKTRPVRHGGKAL